MSSVVYLIGAGPGDPGLMTVRGLQCLASADVVLYDHLVHARVLRFARADAERIDVGTAAPQPLEQEAICYLLAEKAREGKMVARLKWGDRSSSISAAAKRSFFTSRACGSEWFRACRRGLGSRATRASPLTTSGPD